MWPVTVYYTDYWAAEEGQNIESLTRAYAYEQNVLHTSGTLDEPIVPAMIARYDAEIAKGNSTDWLILLSCVGFVAGFDEDSMQYIDNAPRGFGMSPGGGGGGGSRRQRTVRAGQAGRWGDLKGVVGDDLTAHHMPQAALGWTSYEDGGALVMTHNQHRQTRTFGWRGALTVQQDASLSFRDVLAADIWDMRSIAGSSYNEGLLDLISYYRTNFPQLMAK